MPSSYSISKPFFIIPFLPYKSPFLFIIIIVVVIITIFILLLIFIIIIITIFHIVSIWKKLLRVQVIHITFLVYQQSSAKCNMCKHNNAKKIY